MEASIALRGLTEPEPRAVQRGHDSDTAVSIHTPLPEVGVAEEGTGGEEGGGHEGGGSEDDGQGGETTKTLLYEEGRREALQGSQRTFPRFFHDYFES